MGEEEPRWFYVGNGQLRSKDSNGWTDDYRDIDGPKRADEAEVDATAEGSGSPVKTAGPGRRARALSSLGTHSASAARWMMAHLIRLTVAFWRLLVVALRWLSAACARLFASLSTRLVARKQEGTRRQGTRRQATTQRGGGRHRGGADPQTAERPEAPHGDPGLAPIPSRRGH